MKRILMVGLCAAALGAAALAGCDKSEHEVSAAPEMAAPAAEAPAAPAADSIAAPVPATESRAGAAPKPVEKAAEARPPATVPLLAYLYRYRIEAPAKSIDLLVSKHEAACQAAGPTVCQITDANVRHTSKSDVTGTLSMRARPDWLATFRAGLADDAAGVDGSISSNSTGTDDLSGSMVDTEAAIRAKTIERDRLEDLLRRRTGKLDDIMEVEQHLAQVRGEIDAAQSSLTMMKNRVRMSAITIDYGPKGSLARDGAWKPVGEAVRSAQDVMAQVISVLIVLIAALAPIGALGGVIWFGVARLRKMRKVEPAS